MFSKYKSLPEELRQIVDEASKDWGIPKEEAAEQLMATAAAQKIRKLIGNLTHRESLFVACNFSDKEIALIIFYLCKTLMMNRLKDEKLCIRVFPDESPFGDYV